MTSQDPPVPAPETQASCTVNLVFLVSPDPPAVEHCSGGGEITPQISSLAAQKAEVHHWLIQAQH